MGRLPRTARLWLLETLAVATPLSALAWWRANNAAWWWMASAIGLSLAALGASAATVALAQSRHKPLQRMLIETSIRMALPLGVLLALAVVRRDLLHTEFILYFLPFQFVTLAVATAASLRELKHI